MIIRYIFTRCSNIVHSKQQPLRDLKKKRFRLKFQV